MKRYVDVGDFTGLEEGLRCAICKNSIKSDRGCDGGCLVDSSLYKKIMDTVLYHTKHQFSEEEIVKNLSEDISVLRIKDLINTCASEVNKYVLQFKTFTGKIANMDSYEIKEVSINLNDLIRNYGSMFVSEWKLNKKVLTITVNTN